MTTGKATTASRTPHKSLSMLFAMTRQPMPAETASEARVARPGPRTTPAKMLF